MAKLVDTRFEYIFDTLCDVTVALNAIDREIKTIDHIIIDLGVGNVDPSIEKRSIQELKSVLIDLRTKRDRTRRDYEYFYGLFTTNLANKSEETLRRDAKVFGEKEDEIREEIFKLDNAHTNASEANRLRELLRTRYNYIEVIYSFLDETNSLKSKHRKPI